MTRGVCVCVCPVQAPSPSHRLPPGRRTLSREDTRTTRTTTAASWPTRPREDITTPRNTKTLSCKAGKAGSDIITDQNSSNFLSCRQFQTLFASLVVQKAWCPTHTNAHRYLWSTFATRRYRNCTADVSMWIFCWCLWSIFYFPAFIPGLSLCLPCVTITQ